MTEEIQAKAGEIELKHFEIYHEKGTSGYGIWEGPIGDFIIGYVYRLRPDYAEKPKVVECKVFTEDGHLHFRLDNSDRHSLGQACDHIDFIGFKYEGQYITPSPRLYLHKSGQAHDRVSSGYMAEYEVLTPTAVLFKGATK
jgi:hypothetical protein